MFKAYGLHTQIRQNHLRSALLLAGFVILLQALGFAFALLFEAVYGGTLQQIVNAAAQAYAHEWPIAMGAAAVWFVIAFGFHQSVIDYATGAGAVTRDAAPKLYNSLENLCISRGLPMPRLKIIETDGLNAFASGLRKDNYSVTVTRGVVKRRRTGDGARARTDPHPQSRHAAPRGRIDLRRHIYLCRRSHLPQLGLSDR